MEASSNVSRDASERDKSRRNAVSGRRKTVWSQTSLVSREEIAEKAHGNADISVA